MKCTLQIVKIKAEKEVAPSKPTKIVQQQKAFDPETGEWK